MVQVLTLHSNRLTGNVTSLGLCERLHILDLGVSTGGGGGVRGGVGVAWIPSGEDAGRGQGTQG